MNLNLNILSIILSYQYLAIKCDFSTPQPDQTTNIMGGPLTKLFKKLKEEQNKSPNRTGNDFSTPQPDQTTKIMGKPSKKLFKNYTLEFITSPNRTDLNNCKLFIPFQDYNMPMLITAYTATPQILLPNINGNVIVEYHHLIKLSCPNSYFISPIFNRNINEIMVKCIGKSFLEYQQKSYDFRRYKCCAPPQANLRVTKTRCQNNKNNRVLDVGFKTRNKNILFYKICFDVEYKNTLYTWYRVQSPYIKRRQFYKFRPNYINTRLFYPWSIDTQYSITTLRDTFFEILKASDVTDYYLKSYDKKHCLIEGHLIAKAEFNYVFEQGATYFYENTVPQWQLIHDTVWKDIEKIFKRNLATGTSNHLIVTGTHGLCTLPDRYEVETPLYLALPNSMPVPEYLWKLDYDLDKETGVVFLALNNPYKTINNTARICNTVKCPGLDTYSTKYMWSFYCCDMESFEKAHGKLDSIIYEKIY